MSDSVYRERAHLLAHLATLYPAHFETDDHEIDWPVLHLDLPTGQCCWHINTDDRDLFAHVPFRDGQTWDGHTTEEKYQRVDQLTRLRAVVGTTNAHRVRICSEQLPGDGPNNSMEAPCTNTAPASPESSTPTQ